MVAWSDVKNRIKDALISIQSNPLADTLVKSGLKEIPFIGNLLSNIYESSTGSLNDKSAQIIRLLDNLYKATEAQLEKIAFAAEANQEQLAKNSQSLVRLVEITDSVHNNLIDIENAQLDIIKLGSQILEKIEKSEDRIVGEFKTTTTELKNIILGVEKFRSSSLPEQLRFYLKLQEYLRMSNKIFLNQLAIRSQLEESLGTREQVGELLNRMENRDIGADDFLYQARPLMNAEEVKLFDFIRRTTEDMNRFNYYAKSLLENNVEFFRDMTELTILDEHLSWWQAKYDLLKDDPNMCLIYVGVKQKKPFPSKVDELVKLKIEELRKQTLLTQ